jgi:hypothetical protein
MLKSFILLRRENPGVWTHALFDNTALDTMRLLRSPSCDRRTNAERWRVADGGWVIKSHRRPIPCAGEAGGSEVLEMLAVFLACRFLRENQPLICFSVRRGPFALHTRREKTRKPPSSLIAAKKASLALFAVCFDRSSPTSLPTANIMFISVRARTLNREFTALGGLRYTPRVESAATSTAAEVTLVRGAEAARSRREPTANAPAAERSAALSTR